MEKSSRKLQIGVMGSAADLKYSKKIEKLAEKVGYWVAKNGAALIFGAEKDYDSLSTAACRGAKKARGLTIGVTYGKGFDIFEKKNVDVVIASGLERGGGRELTLVLSCDAIIALNGGSGTLTEIAIAYQANIPVVVLKNTGGWSEKLGGQYLDSRNRIKIEVAENPKEAVNLVVKLVKQKYGPRN
ncbi:MAG: LOG family protein [Candidatus Portnoybacteria bacterium]|nr:LOG family protein [Candidatus Portnoybacteria bacterium]